MHDASPSGQGFLDILDRLGSPGSDVDMRAFEWEVLRCSNSIWPDDDLTVIEIHIQGL